LLFVSTPPIHAQESPAFEKIQQDYSHNPVYTRNLTTSYKGQLLEISFTSNLNTDPKLKQEIDRIMDSVQLEE